MRHCLRQRLRHAHPFRWFLLQQNALVAFATAILVFNDFQVNQVVSLLDAALVIVRRLLGQVKLERGGIGSHQALPPDVIDVFLNLLLVFVE